MITLILIALAMGFGAYIGFWLGFRAGISYASSGLKSFLNSLTDIDKSYFAMLINDYNDSVRKARDESKKPKSSLNVVK